MGLCQLKQVVGIFIKRHKICNRSSFKPPPQKNKTVMNLYDP